MARFFTAHQTVHGCHPRLFSLALFPFLHFQELIILFPLAFILSDPEFFIPTPRRAISQSVILSRISSSPSAIFPVFFPAQLDPYLLFLASRPNSFISTVQRGHRDFVNYYYSRPWDTRAIDSRILLSPFARSYTFVFNERHIPIGCIFCAWYSARWCFPMRSEARGNNWIDRFI